MRYFKSVVFPWTSRMLMLFCLLASVWPQLAAAEGDAGQPGAFLTYGAGARAIAMGRAFAGLADDVTALYWNPAGLPSLRQNQVMLQHVSLIDGNSYQYLGYGHIFSYIGTLGVGLVMLNQGEAEGRNTYNELTESFANRHFGMLLGFGADVTPQLSAGGTFKIINQTMMSLSGTGFGADVGLLYRPMSFLNLGLNFQNLLAPSITLKEEAEKYPMNMIFGVGLIFFGERLKLDVDVSKNMDQDQVKPRGGVEVRPIPDYPDVTVRAGVDDTEINVGAGYSYLGFTLDYALGFQTEELMHKVSLSYSFGGFVLEAHGEPASFSPVGINKVSVIKIQSQTKFQVRIWTLDIINEAGALVKKYSGEGSPPDHIVWDGLEDNLTPMPDGNYKVLLTIEDAAGMTHKAPEARIQILSVLPLGVSPVEMLE
ncbi:PorV/PorQ family protein [candidate division FCPU426 bacterium]|nr:PorV/PorQ family protein [candidate division FCPU426 bacterium]